MYPIIWMLYMFQKSCNRILHRVSAYHYRQLGAFFPTWQFLQSSSPLYNSSGQCPLVTFSETPRSYYTLSCIPWNFQLIMLPPLAHLQSGIIKYYKQVWQEFKLIITRVLNKDIYLCVSGECHIFPLFTLASPMQRLVLFIYAVWELNTSQTFNNFPEEMENQFSLTGTRSSICLPHQGVTNVNYLESAGKLSNALLRNIASLGRMSLNQNTGLFSAASACFSLMMC